MLNVSFKSSLGPSSGNVYVPIAKAMASTTDMNTITFRRCGMGYQIIHMTS